MSNCTPPLRFNAAHPFPRYPITFTSIRSLSYLLLRFPVELDGSGGPEGRESIIELVTEENESYCL